MQTKEYFLGQDAANRLTTRISNGFTYPFSANPITDALTIVHCLRKMLDDGSD